MEAKLALTEVAFQSDDKLAAKNLSEHRDGKKEARMRWNPTRVIERQSASGDHTMGVRVMFEFLIPGVEHTALPLPRRSPFWRWPNVALGSRVRSEQSSPC